MIYYDNAATTFPKPVSVPAAVQRCMRDFCGNPGRGGHALSLAASQSIYAVRENAAELFGLPLPENVVFTQNATHAINTVINGILKAGDHVLYDSFSHNSVIRPLHAAEARGISSTCYPITKADRMMTEEELLSSCGARIRSDTRLICATHASNICSAVLNIRAIGALCAARGILLLVDASQSAGLLPIDMKRDGIDYLCCSGHKGLYGPQGTGLLLIAEKAAVPEPSVFGGSGVFSRETNMPVILPERLEAGTLSTPSIVGLGAGIDFVRARTTDEIFHHHTILSARLREIIQTVHGCTLYGDFVEPHGTLLFGIEGREAEEIAAALDHEGVAVRAGLHCAPIAHETLKTPPDGAVRISVGAFNTLAETERFAKVLRFIAG